LKTNACELLGAYHFNLNSYIKAKNWKSLSSNELIEKSLRSLPFNFNFNKTCEAKSKKIINKLTVSLYYLTLPLLAFLIFAYFLFFFYKRGKLASTKETLTDIFFLRGELSQKRLKNILNIKNNLKECTLVVDDFTSFKLKISDCKVTYLSSYLRFEPLKFVGLVLIEIKLILEDSINNLPFLTQQNLAFSIARVPHLFLLYMAMDNLCKRHCIEHIRSFEMISRFSSLLNKIVSKYRIPNSTGYPHGLEYDIYYPNSCFGRVIYCTSETALIALSDRYPDIDFIFDQELINSLFCFDLMFQKQRKSVYYTDARNPLSDYDNIKILSNSIDFIKLHPSDDKSLYVDIGINFIDDFIDALSLGIVIMRASTVIFEAQISGCTVYCLATSAKEVYLLRYLYPTLSSLSVITITNINDLNNILMRKE